jgi:hypothetical protein
LFYISLQQDWQRRFALEMGGALKICHMDETHHLNDYRFPATCFGSHDAYGNFVPLATMICSASCETHFITFLRHIQRSLGQSFVPHTIMVDKCDAERLAIAKVFPNAKLRLCYWHLIGMF